MELRLPGRTTRALLAGAMLWAALPLAGAATISGVVRNESGTGLSNVDIDFIDACTGDNIFLTNDKTAADGTYSIVVPSGTYDIHYTPPGSPPAVAAGERDNYTVSANANLGTTTLHPGRVVSGTVRNPSGVGLANVDLKFNNQTTGEHVFMGKDVTSATGAYSYRVPPGTWTIDFRPPATTAFTDAVRSNLVVGSSDISGLVDTLGNGFNVFGTIQDKRNNLVKNVDIDVYDNCTGQKVATAHDNTGVDGKFSVYVPAGTYLVQYDSPRCKALESTRFPGTKVDRATDMKTTKLNDAVLVSGRVLDELGAPLFDARLKFYDTLNKNARQETTGDHTDAAGTFSIYVPPSTFDIIFEPPVGKNDVPRKLAGVVVSTATALGDVQLSAGIPVSGSVVSPSNAGVLNVNVGAVDSATRAVAILAHDSTAADGTFTVVVPAGTYDFQYDPPACTGYAPADQRDRVISSTTTLPTMHLVVGAHATGTVHDTHALPVATVDLDFFPAGSALKSYTPNDTIDATGTYDTTVQPQSYDINYIPPAGTRLRPAQRLNISVLVNTTIPDTVLADGWLVSGFVKDNATLAAVAGATVDFYPPGASAPAWTPHHVTLVDGSYNIAVDAGTWDILYTPPVGSPLAPRWRRGVVVGADLALADTLLLPLTVPSVSIVAPNSGSTAGGQSVTITGTGFQPDATVLIGGVTAKNVVVSTSTSLTATTPPHPAGKADVTVTNPGNQIGTKLQAYTYGEPALPVRITVTKSGGNVVLTWTSTGQPNYTVFRNANPTGFTDASILTTTSGTTYTDTTSGSGPGIKYYQVD